MAETQFKYDVFLSHNSKDKAAVEKIARTLRDEYQLKVWLDKWNLIPGKDSQEDLEKGLNECETIAVFIGETGFGKWENKEMRVAIAQHTNDESRRVIPVFLPGAPVDAQLPPLLGIHTWVNLRSGIDTKDALYLLYCGIVGKEPGDYSTPNASNNEVWNLKHPYPMPPNFTGRLAERTMLTQWLDDDSENHLFILRALGGFGKSALTWQWLTHDVNPKTWKKVIFWSFYEGDASFDHFVEETLKYLNYEIPPSKRDQVDALLYAMQAENILLIMDGFERTLRAYSSMNAAYQGDEELKLDDNQLDCTDLNAEIFLRSACSLPKLQSKVLMTTRLTPRAVKPRGEFMLGCRETELTAMQKADAVEFFHKEGIQGNRVEIESACETYGYHPLSLHLLAGRILKDFENPGDIVVAQKLKIDGDLKQQKHHVLEVAFNSLPQQEKDLLCIISCFRSPVEYKTLQSITKSKDTLDAELNDLVERGLLHRATKAQSTNAPITFLDLHPIVRHYAYDHFTDEKRRKEAHVQLANHFIGNINTMSVTNTKVKKLEDLTPVIELYHHMVGAGNLDEARKMYYERLQKGIYFQFCAYQLQVELLRALFIDGEDKPPRLKDESARAWTINELANTYSVSGQPRRAESLFLINADYDEKPGRKQHLAIGLGNMASTVQIHIGALSAAERNLRRAIDLDKELGIKMDEAFDGNDLGKLLIYKGDWKEAEQQLNQSYEIFKKEANVQALSVAWSYRALRFLLIARGDPKSKIENLKTAIECARRALELADETAKMLYSYPRDYVDAYLLLGTAYLMNNNLTLAEENLSKALNICRQINSVDAEANILLELARLRYAQGNFEETQEKASEALMITERSGYVLQAADVNLFLAQYALEQEKDKAKAKQYAEEAKKLATCDGPPYYYKVAYEEAEAMLEKLK